jgi:antitoxin PrlF
MTTITVSSKGQITVPVALREALKLHPGSILQASIDAQGRLVLVPDLHEPADLFKDRPVVSRALTLEEMDEAIGRAVR